MATVHVNRVQDPASKALPVFEEMEQMCRRVKERAFAFFQERGGQVGHALEDWLRAEREAFGWPAAELRERENEYELEVTLPGFDANEIEVTASPTQILVHAKLSRGEQPDRPRVIWSEFGKNDVYRRFEMPHPVDVDHLAATLNRGILKVVAVKAAPVQARTIAVSAGA